MSHTSSGVSRRSRPQQRARRRPASDVSASSSDAAIAAITAAASGWYMRPSMPGMPKSGRKTAMTMSVAKAIGPADLDRRRKRLLARRADASPRRRCGATMFSVTMIDASTSSPTAIARPPKVIVLMPTPERRSRIPASAIDSGIVSVTMSAARTSPSSANDHQHDEARRRASTARPTPPSAERTSADWS